jgi:hypothetical protein
LAKPEHPIDEFFADKGYVCWVFKRVGVYHGLRLFLLLEENMPERNEDQLEEQLLERVYLFECLEEALDIARLHERFRDEEFVHLVDRRLIPFVREEKRQAEKAVAAYRRRQS